MRKNKSKIKLWPVLLMLCVAFGIFTFCLKEEEDQTVPDWKEVTWTAQDQEEEEREPSYREAEPVFVSDTADISLGAYAGLTAKQKNLYNALKKQIREVADGERTSSVFPVSMKTYGFTEPVSEDTVEEVSFALYADLPYDLYWYDSRSGIMIYTIDSIITEFRFCVSKEYSADGEAKTFVTDLRKIERAKKAAENAAGVVADNEGKSDIEKLRAYKDYICREAEYDYRAFSDADGSPLNSWHLVNVFDCDPDTNVVCEGYAKAFQYLCDSSCFSSDVKCYRVSGTLISTNYEHENPVETSSGPHAWNIVRIEEQSYLVDVTNCDSGKAGAFIVDEYGGLKEGKESGDLFFMLNLRGVNAHDALPDALSVSGSVDSGYGIDRGEISFDIGGGQIRTFFRHIAKYEYDDSTIRLYPDEVLSLSTAD